MNKLAICIIAYNEENNIGPLLDKIINEKIDSSKIFVYTDGSSDKTPEIVDSSKAKYPNLIDYTKGVVNLGKNHAFNNLLKKTVDYKLVIFMDADIDPERDSIKNLYNYLNLNINLSAASPLLIPYVDDLLNPLEKMNANLYKKARLHAVSYGRYKYLSGRMYCIRSELLKPIPQESYFDDFYINLQIPYALIGICKDSVVYYRRPSKLVDFIRYNIRLGKAMASIKKLSNKLWIEQNKRVSLNEYAVFDLTKYKFITFFLKLTLFEKIIFVVNRCLSTIFMYWGFLTYKPNEVGWKAISSTKITYGDIK